MIVAESFINSAKARDIEFTTCEGNCASMSLSSHERTSLHSPEDRPLVAQFAAKTAQEFAEAAAMIAPYVDAVDLNCGCPQR